MSWVMYMQRAKQMSESIELGILLALSGGFMDAYSYVCRGKVFANAQTGNILLFGIHLSEGHYSHLLNYFFPVVAFGLGIFLTEWIKMRHHSHLHWRQPLVLIEALVLVQVSFMPQSFNLLANSLTSFVCGIQVEAFRKIHNRSIATTMCIGNLRSAIENTCLFLTKKQSKYLESSILYMGTIFCFVMGAILGNICIGFFSEKAILFCSLVLVIVFIIMFIERKDIAL